MTPDCWERIQPVVCTLREDSLLCCTVGKPILLQKKHLFAIVEHFRHFLYLSPSVFALGPVCLLLRVYRFHIRDTTVNIVSVVWSCAGPTCCSGDSEVSLLSHSVTVTTAHIVFARWSTLLVLFLVCPMWRLFDIHSLKDVMMPMETFFATNSFDILTLDSSHLLKPCTTLATGTSLNLKRFLRPHCLAPKLLR